MFKARFVFEGDTRNNICGIAIRRLRKGRRLSQAALAYIMEDVGLIIDKNAIQRIETGQRFITDIELIAFSKIFNVPVEDLYKSEA